MKIVADIDGGFLVEATAAELLGLAGFEVDDPDAPELKRGDTLPVASIISTLRAVKEKRAEVEAAIAELRALADSLELAKDAVTLISQES